MSFLPGDSSEIVIDAVLTKRGREILALGDGNFKITKCAFADDGVDYNLWNPDNQNGSNYYGQAIENMPVQEANPNQEVSLAYKLITLAPNSTHVLYLSNVQPAITLDSDVAVIINPTTLSVNVDAEAGYKATIMDGTYAQLSVKDPVNNTARATTPALSTGMSSNSESVIGKSFYLTRKQLASTKTTTIEIEGNASGARATINLTINAPLGTAASLAQSTT